MADNEFLLRIIGDTVSLRSVDVDDLTTLIRGFRGALASVAQSDGKEDDVGLYLVGLAEERSKNSETLTLAGSPGSLTYATKLVSALSSGQSLLLPERSKKYLRSVWETIFSNGWDVCEFEGNGSHIGHAAISRERELFPSPLTLRGVTVLYGKCVRAGGESKRTAQLRLLDDSLITIRLKTQDLAKRLGERLYQTVGLRGEAIWSAGEKRMLEKFRADELTNYTDRDTPERKRSIVESFEALAKAAGTRWDNVDPDEFIAEQRRD